MGKASTKRVLLIGWDAADWKIINPLLDAGLMPALEKIVNNGVIGNIATLDPPLSPLLWTSIATGKRADKHGVLGFAEPDTKRNTIRPVNVTSRKVKAVWNILHHHGKKSNVVGWWPSHPAEPINGVMISNFFQRASVEYGKPWPLPKMTVHPDSLVEEMKELRVHFGELTEAHILPFVPDAGKIDQEKDNSLIGIAKITAENASIHAASTYLMEHTDWDFMAIYYDGIDHFSHGFMKCHPPRLPTIPEDQFHLYKNVVNGAYIFHDMMLERLMKLAGDDTTVIILSDHGFHSDHFRILQLPKLPAAPAMEHNPLGIFCISGPGIRKDERVYGASLLDITPTILTLFGIPIGMDMDGKPLLSIFRETILPEFINSWEEVTGDFGMHPPERIEDTYASAEALEQLIQLGYIEDPGEDKIKAMEKTGVEAKYNLSRVYASSKNFDKAYEILQELTAKEPDDDRFKLDLLNYCIELKKFEEAREIVKELRNKKKEAMFGLDMLEGILCLHENEPEKALELLRKVEKFKLRLPILHIEMGKVYLKLQQYRDAQIAFNKALNIDESSPVAYHGLAICFLRTGFYEEAVENAINAIGIMYHFPSAHYHLGEALYKMKKYKEAAQAFEVCLTLVPRLTKARSWLIRIYTENFIDREKAAFHEQILENQMKGEIIIVSGLPRSGTSLMMQMLEAGGLDILKDDVRKADNNNPKGYYEFEKVKSLARDNSWLEEANGKAVKVIAQLLQHLPDNYRYKIIFMTRNINEIIKSQQIMLGKEKDAFPIAIAQAFNKELEKVAVWSDKEPEVALLYVDYKSVINNPAREVQKILEFLNTELNESKMVSMVDPSLYRNKSM